VPQSLRCPIPLNPSRVAELYAANGASVVVADLDEKGGQSTVDTIVKAGGKAHFVKADSSKPEDNELETPLLTNHLSADQMKALVTLHPIGRLGKPEEVAELVLWLS